MTFYLIQLDFTRFPQLDLQNHVSFAFVQDLLGRDVIQTKRDAENTLGYQPLTITGKIKVNSSLISINLNLQQLFQPSQTPKKSQFSLKRKKSLKNEDSEFSNYVCPMTGETNNTQKGNVLMTNNLTVSLRNHSHTTF